MHSLSSRDKYCILFSSRDKYCTPLFCKCRNGATFLCDYVWKVWTFSYRRAPGSSSCNRIRWQNWVAWTALTNRISSIETVPALPCLGWIYLYYFHGINIPPFSPGMNTVYISLFWYYTLYSTLYSTVLPFSGVNILNTCMFS